MLYVIYHQEQQDFLVHQIDPGLHQNLVKHYHELPNMLLWLLDPCLTTTAVLLHATFNSVVVEVVFLFRVRVVFRVAEAIGEFGSDSARGFVEEADMLKSQRYCFTFFLAGYVGKLIIRNRYFGMEPTHPFVLVQVIGKFCLC